MVDYLEQEHITSDEMPSGVSFLTQNIGESLRGISVPVFREDGEISSTRLDWLVKARRGEQSDRTYLELSAVMPSHIIEQILRVQPIKHSTALTNSVEYLDSSQRNLMLEGVIDNSYTLALRANMQITDCEPTIVKVSGYDIRDSLTNLGITKSFYDALDVLLKEASFQAVFGVNNDQNISYFLNKLGRQRLANVSQSMQRKVWKSLGTRTNSEFITVKTL